MKIPKPKEVLSLFKNQKNRPMRSKEILKRLGVPNEGRSLFKKVLRKMVSQGKISRIDGGKYIITASKKSDNGPRASNGSGRGLVKTGNIIGKFVKTGKTGKFIPRDERIPEIFLMPQDIKDLRSNALVVAELSKKRNRSGKLQARMIDVIGKAGDIEAEKKALLVEYELPLEFPTQAREELKTLPDSVENKAIENRVDLRKETIFTIDGEDAKDFDDAVGIKKTRRGYKLYVSVADVSHYVGIGSEIDNVALERATSIYLTDRVIPMLPEKLSNDLCSLVPYEDRLTKTVEMDFNKKGEMKDFRIYDSVIKSVARLTYRRVADILDGKCRVSKKEKKIAEKLGVMKRLFTEIRNRRVEKGELNFDIPEIELVRDVEGTVVDIIRADRNVAHEIIEEFMISANAAVAGFIHKSDVPSIYRIHEPPESESISELAEALKKLGYKMAVNGNSCSGEIQKIIEKSRNKSNKTAVNMLILRSMNKAVYSTLPHGHFGLALEHYTHFTSPIRRYADLIVHRIINSLNNGKAHPYNEDSLNWISEHTSKKERLADSIEREATDLETAYYMRTHVNSEFDGTVISVLPFGMFVEVKGMFVEGLVPKETIANWRKRWFDIGQSVRVKIVEADVEKRRITLNLAE